MTYQDELTKTMMWLGTKPNTIFIGQGLRYPGNALYSTFAGIPMSKRIELPVFENTQLGVSIGLAIKGKIVISVYPRMDFLLSAFDQLVNHLDKELYEMSGRVIIRTCVGSTKPMHPGVQHCGDYTKGLRELLHNTPIIELKEPKDIYTGYLYAYGQKVDRQATQFGAMTNKWIMVEYGDNYDRVE